MSVRVVAVILTIAVALLGSSRGLGAQTRGAPVSLRLVWTDVTAGALSAPPTDVRTSEGAFLLLATADRRLRLVDRAGDTVSVVPTGIRRPTELFRERPGVFLLISDALGRRGRGMTAVGDAAIVRVRVAGSTLRTVGSPGEEGSGIVENASAIALDGEGNLYSFADSGLVGHGSTTGVELWRRALPGGVTTVVGGSEGVYAALSDGRVFVFDSRGEGRPAVHWPSPILDMAGAKGGEGAALLIRDDTQRLSLVVLEEGPRTLWHLDGVAGWSRGGTPDVLLPTAVAARDGRVRLMGNSTSPAWTLETRSPVIATTAVHEGRGYVLLDTDNRLMLVDASGSVAATLRLASPPIGMWWLPDYRRLLVAYPDWRIQAFAVDGLDREGARSADGDVRSASTTAYPGTGALVALARTVLAGHSIDERRALLDRLRVRLDEGALYGALVDYRYILAELLQEAYRNPRIAGGVVVNDAPEVRARAVAALGALSDRASRVTLTGSVRFDPDASVAAAALHAIARYGVDEFGAFPHAVRRFADGSSGERAALAPAMVDFLAYTAVTVENPALAARAIDLIARSSVSRDLRRRAVRLGR